MENEITIEQMAGILGGPAPVVEQPAVEVPAVEQPAVEQPAVEQPAVEQPATEQPVVEQPAPDTAPLVPLQQNKAQEAFAAMRIQNKQMNDTLKGVATLLGINSDVDPTALNDALQAKILENQAKTQNVPVELLQRLQTLEQQNSQFTAQQRQRNIELGFETIKTTYKLNPEQMNKFAEDLISNGMNPFTQDIDLGKAYRDLHFDEIVAAKVQEAVLAEQARAAGAAANGSNPGNQQGNQQQGDNITKVNSVQDLNTWLSQQTSK